MGEYSRPYANRPSLSLSTRHRLREQLDKDRQMTFTITRDDTGRISSIEHKDDGDPKGDRLEVMDYTCLHVTASGIERR